MSRTFAESMEEAQRISIVYSERQVWYQSKFMWLFLFLLGVLLCYPYSFGTSFHYFIYRALFCIVILFSVYALNLKRSLVAFALILAAPPIIQHTIYAADLRTQTAVINSFLSLAFDVFIVIVIFRRIFAKAKADAEAIFGALCIYLFVGFSFASIFRLTTYFEPHAFYLDPTVNSHTIFDRLDAVYYSFGTMTSLGANGITPVSGEARLLTIIEALLGVLFLAVLVSRLLAAYGVKDALLPSRSAEVSTLDSQKSAS